MSDAGTVDMEQLQAVVRRQWGFPALRPLQEEAMRAVLDGRDSLVVLPTGGGKSLCYQAPAAASGEVTVVVSPLISLMKDQVDALRSNGVPAVPINSSLSQEERREYHRQLTSGEVRLLFVSPEKLLTQGFLKLLEDLGVRTFAIDEAHCVSHWGHDFRPEYRQLGQLKERFPQASVHGYTATATEQVREDIVAQLGLDDPAVLVGNFDRPNLSYRIEARTSLLPQVLQTLQRHGDEAGIIYCIRRRDVDELTEALRRHGHEPLPYHAGLDHQQRQAAQNAFATGRCDLIVATVAFGMGIDRSNIRFVLHTGMPKSVEHYQQETGRAGRDGLEAECVLLYSRADLMLWKFILEKSAEEQPVDDETQAAAMRHLNEMDRYCQPVACRHRALVRYFGQEYAAENCQACDVCLDGAESIADAREVAQKILSCVARVDQRFGIKHVAEVLRGADTEAVRSRQHDQLSTYGLLSGYPDDVLRHWIDQLLGQEVLVRSADQYPVLKLNEASWEVMRGQREVRLTEPRPTTPRSAAPKRQSWEGVDRPLFELLCQWRREQADARGAAPDVIFGDATLRALARHRPATLEKLRWVPGLGETKLADFGAALLELIDGECQARGLTRDAFETASPTESDVAAPPPTLSLPASRAASMFRQGASVEEVMREMERARSTVMGYLAEYISVERPESISAWVSNDVYQRVSEASGRLNTRRLKPIFLELGENVPYEEIRLVVAHLPET